MKWEQGYQSGVNIFINCVLVLGGACACLYIHMNLNIHDAVAYNTKITHGSDYRKEQVIITTTVITQCQSLICLTLTMAVSLRHQ